MLKTFSATCSEAWIAGDLSLCKPFGFDLVAWVTILTALAGLLAFAFAKLRRRESGGITPRSRLSWQGQFKRLCGAIKPIMDENARMFGQFGPNSSAGSEPKDVRYDLGVWKQIRPEIAANNARIKQLIQENVRHIPREHAALFRSWVRHIDAFAAHVADDRVDYRQHQFPRDVVEVVWANG